MEKKKIYGNRKIKCIGNCVEKDNKFLHPITLQLITNKSKNNKCATKYHLDNNNKGSFIKNCNKDDKLDNFELINYMALPYINLSIKQIINIYKVNSIDNLIEWVENNIKNNKPFEHINRILNIWMKDNYNIVKDFNDIFNDLYLKIYNNYWKKNKIKDVKNKIDKFINKWLKNNKETNFSFDLGNDLKKYLSK